MGPTVRARAAVAAVWDLADRSAGHRLHRASHPRTPVPPVALYCVYRSANAAVVRALLDRMPNGSTARLHALEDEAPVLARWTVSSGAGARMPLLDALVRSGPPEPGQYVLLADDDAVMLGPGLAVFVAVAHAGGLDLSMPAHGPGSHWTFRVTCHRAVSTARLTRFVEVGPLLLLSPRAFTRIHPFPVTARMGWGLDVLWSSLSSEGLRLGIVDATPMRHLGAVGGAYDRDHEVQELARHSAQVGVASAYELAGHSGPTWRPWRRTPPWEAPGTGPPDRRPTTGPFGTEETR